MNLAEVPPQVAPHNPKKARAARLSSDSQTEEEQTDSVRKQSDMQQKEIPTSEVQKQIANIRKRFARAGTKGGRRSRI